MVLKNDVFTLDACGEGVFTRRRGTGGGGGRRTVPVTWDAVYLPLGRLVLVGDPVPAPLRAVADGPGDWAAAASSARYDLHAKRTEGGVYSEQDNQNWVGMGLLKEGTITQRVATPASLTF